MTPDEQELANCRKEQFRLRILQRYNSLKAEEYGKRHESESQRINEILARIEAAKGSTDGN